MVAHQAQGGFVCGQHAIRFLPFRAHIEYIRVQLERSGVFCIHSAHNVPARGHQSGLRGLQYWRILEAFPSTKKPYTSRTVELAQIEEFCIWISVLLLIWIPLAKFFSKSRWPMRTSSIRTSRDFSISTPNRWTSAPLTSRRACKMTGCA